MDGTSLVVVTGGAGFIGSHLVDALLAAGHRVVVLDDFSTGKRANLAHHGSDAKLHVVECDVSAGITSALAPLVAQHGPVDRIVHLAAQVSVVASLEDPQRDLRVNYGATLHVLEYARAHRAGKVVFSSSSAIYGETHVLPVDEEAAALPLSPYGLHKLASERALTSYATVHGLATSALRFFNVYGPRQDPSSPYSGVISIFSDRARAGRPLTIFGDGAQTRDFVYVGDVVRALLAAITAPGATRVANVGTGSEITIRELAATIVDLCGGRSAIDHAPARAGEIVRSVARIDRLRDELGVVAATRLVDGLRATLAER